MQGGQPELCSTSTFPHLRARHRNVSTGPTSFVLDIVLNLLLAIVLLPSARALLLGDIGKTKKHREAYPFLQFVTHRDEQILKAHQHQDNSNNFHSADTLSNGKLFHGPDRYSFPYLEQTGHRGRQHRRMKPSSASIGTPHATRVARPVNFILVAAWEAVEPG